MIVQLNRWRRVAPAWLGNEQAAEPFHIEVCRLFRSEARAFGARLVGLYDRDVIDADAIVDTFAGVIRGPVERVEIDGSSIEPGDFRRLAELAADEYFGEGCLFLALVSAYRQVNEVSVQQAGESAGRPGTSATTSPGSEADAAPAHAADA